MVSMTERGADRGGVWSLGYRVTFFSFCAKKTAQAFCLGRFEELRTTEGLTQTALRRRAITLIPTRAVPRRRAVVPLSGTDELPENEKIPPEERS